MSTITIDKLLDKSIYADAETLIYSFKGRQEANKYNSASEIKKRVIPITKLPKGSHIGTLALWDIHPKNPTILWWGFYTLDPVSKKKKFYYVFTDRSSGYNTLDIDRTVKEYNLGKYTEQGQFKKEQKEREDLEDRNKGIDKKWWEKLIDEAKPILQKVGTGLVIAYVLKKGLEYNRDTKLQKRLYR